MAFNKDFFNGVFIQNCGRGSGLSALRAKWRSVTALSTTTRDGLQSNSFFFSYQPSVEELVSQKERLEDLIAEMQTK